MPRRDFSKVSKPCRRRGCLVRIVKPTQWELNAVRYCSHRCANKDHAGAALRARQDQGLHRACVRIMKALGLNGDPPIALVRAVRRLRTTGYRSGWGCVTNKVRRAVARGVLIHREGGTNAAAF